MTVRKQSQPIEGIKCVVNTCEYNVQGQHCVAEKIEVAPRDAKTAGQTDCVTFIAKQQ